MILSHAATIRTIAATTDDAGGLFSVSSMPSNALHETVFYILYAMCVLATFLAVERIIYFWMAWRNARGIERALKHGDATFDGVPAEYLKSKLPAALALAEVQAHLSYIRERGDLEDATDTAYIHAKHRLHQHIWLLDTVITAAPLLGLLGTILGIIDTFHTLASSGVSDPSAVSRGIGVALIATAIGIGTALYALLLHNIFQAQFSRILDVVKIILMRVTLVQQR